MGGGGGREGGKEGAVCMHLDLISNSEAESQEPANLPGVESPLHGSPKEV